MLNKYAAVSPAHLIRNHQSGGVLLQQALHSLQVPVMRRVQNSLLAIARNNKQLANAVCSWRKDEFQPLTSS